MAEKDTEFTEVKDEQIDEALNLVLGGIVPKDLQSMVDSGNTGTYPYLSYKMRRGILGAASREYHLGKKNG
jgi:hypothetical protein